MGRQKDGVIKRGTKWSYVVRVPDPSTGKSKQVWVGGFANEQEAKEARDQARVEARRGEYVDRSNVSLADYLREWLDTHALEVRPATLAGYRYQAEQYVIPRIGHMRVQALRPMTLTKLYIDLLDHGGKNGRPLSRRTVDYVHATVRKALNDAVHIDGLLPSNPAMRAKRPKGKGRAVHDVWDADQLRLFLDQVRDHQWFALYRLAAYSGARRGELLALKWADVDWANNLVRIRSSAGMVENKRVEGATKSGRERRVSLDERTVIALRDHRKRQIRDQAVAGAAWEDSGLVFTNGLGRPIYPTSVYARLVRTVRDYNAANEQGPPLPYSRFHDLRHVHATLLLKAGVPVHVVAARLGHADPSVTLRVYAHVIPEQAAEVADRFAALLEPETATEDEGDADEGR
ncbi:MAG: site-specific integrase [Nocardioides sp.]|nr:site-specific integrase [Nocardioides sp.]